MLTRRSALQAFAGGISAAPNILRGARRPIGDKPNLLFLWTDEQRADTLAAYGNYRFHMPTLNRLASQSVVFQNAYCCQPVCTPSRGSIMTGLYPHQHGSVANNIPLRRDCLAQPELLNDSAYATAYMGKWHLGDEIFAQHGFEQWVSIEDGYYKHYSPGHDSKARSDYYYFLDRLGYKPDTKSGLFSRNFAVRRPIEHTKPTFLAQNASRFILEHRSQPWFLHVNFLEPHMPFYGPLNDLHTEAEAPIPANYPGDQIDHEPGFYRRIRQGYLDHGFGGQDLHTRPGWQRLNRNYAGLCTQVDGAVGQILWALESSGQADNTVIVFTSDHGEMMGAHSLIGKMVFYEEAARIPLLIRAPMFQSRSIAISRPVSQIDLVPTILQLLGKKAPENLPGQSLLPVAAGEAPRQDHVFLEWAPNPDGPSGRAVISPEGEKLAIYRDDNNLFFDRRRDPLELNNLYYQGGDQARITALRKQLDRWQKGIADTLELGS
ncbi:MAG: sulfatase-like hydrolase/transferase [Bryobacterales bacterium]|nr:sulfatase-like hydrolase/transferase [Bryobacterales bacterium]